MWTNTKELAGAFAAAFGVLLLGVAIRLCRPPKDKDDK